MDGAAAGNLRTRARSRACRRAWKAFSAWVLEESFAFQDPYTGRYRVVTTFSYPAWFLASVLVAAYMLGYHVSGGGCCGAGASAEGSACC